MPGWSAGACTLFLQLCKLTLDRSDLALDMLLLLLQILHLGLKILDLFLQPTLLVLCLGKPGLQMLQALLLANFLFSLPGKCCLVLFVCPFVGTFEACVYVRIARDLIRQKCLCCLPPIQSLCPLDNCDLLH